GVAPPEEDGRRAGRVADARIEAADHEPEGVVGQAGGRVRGVRDGFELDVARRIAALPAIDAVEAGEELGQRRAAQDLHAAGDVLGQPTGERELQRVLAAVRN